MLLLGLCITSYMVIIVFLPCLVTGAKETTDGNSKVLAEVASAAQ